jgi:hypothetical protein
MEDQEVTRSSTILKNRWEGFKDEITFLYLGCGYTLQEVMEFMKSQHSFDAKEKQYKDKFDDWNVKKNLTKAQKLDLYTHIQQHGGVGDANFLINGKPLRWSRISRPVQQDGNKFTIVAQGVPGSVQNDSPPDFLGPGTSPSFQTQVPGQNYNPHQMIAGRSIQGISTFQRQILQESPESSTSELILRHLYFYYRWYSDKPQAIYHHTQSLGAVFDVIDEGLNLLVARRPTAFAKFQEACDGAKALFRHQPFQITVQFSACFSQYKWFDYPEVRRELMRYLTGMAIGVLGPNHYLPKILQLMPLEHTSAGLSSRVIRLTTDTTLSKFQDSSTDLLECMPHLRLLVGRMHRDTGEESALLSNLSQDVLITNLLGEAAPRDVSLVYKLGNLRLSQNRLDEAEELFAEAIAVAGQSPDASGARISKVCMLTFNCMGVLFGRRGDLTVRTRYYRSALEWSTNIVPNEALNGEDKRRRVKWLEDVVRYHNLNGDVWEVQSLREQYHDLWANLDQMEFGSLGGSGHI